MTTMTLSQVAEKLNLLMQQHGDVPMVLWDLDGGKYFTLADTNIEAQQMKDGSVRVSIGVNSYSEPVEPDPDKRPL